MPTSIRLAIIERLAARMRDVALRSRATFVLHPRVPVKRENTPALLLIVDGEPRPERKNLITERGLFIRLAAVVHDDNWRAADAMIVAAHAALMEDPSQGGLATGTSEEETAWETEFADGDAIFLPAAYTITYQTAVADLSASG